MPRLFMKVVLKLIKEAVESELIGSKKPVEPAGKMIDGRGMSVM